MTTADAPRNRGPLIGLFLLFAAPLAVAFLLYYGTDWRPGGRVNNGDLYEPVRTLPAVELPTTGAKLAAPLLRDLWSLVYIGAGACDARCEKALYDSRQVRLALDKDQDRVQRVFLHAGDCCAAPLVAAHPDLAMARIDGVEAAALLAMFTAPEGDVMTAGRLYLVDPLGNLVLSYPADAEPKGLLKDLERLLKLSHIG